MVEVEDDTPLAAGENPEPGETPEATQERVDSIWASFKEDVKSVKTSEIVVKPTPVETTKVVEEYEFAGEKVQ